MELNKIHHLDNREGLAQLPEKCANLIISDPPYYEVKGEFDFIWKSFDEYLEFMKQQAILYKRILADNGTLFVYGHAKRIAYVQTIFDKYFNLENNAVWDKGSFMGLEESEDIRSFAPCTERVLFYSLDQYNLTSCVTNIRDYIRQEITMAKGKIVLKEVNTALGTATNGGGVASACLSLDKAEPGMITQEMYEKLQAWLGPDYLRREYEELRREYEELRRPYNNHFKLQEVLRFGNEQNTTGAKFSHDTVKPEKLTRALILTCSRPGDLVVVPFAGSGTECAMAAKEGRRFIGFDTHPKYVEMSNKRVLTHLQAPDLFRQAS